MIDYGNRDMLSSIFDMQSKLNKRIGCPSFVLMTEQDRSKWALKFSRALDHERIEMEMELAKSWKWWKKSATNDLPEARDEAIDMLHFMISIMQSLGMDHENVYEAYCKKNEINHERQNNEY